MELSLAVTLAVLLAALMHAAWNAMVKRGGDTLLEMALLAMAASVLSLPLLPLVPLPAPAAWPFLAASMLLHVGYYATLVATYRRVDLTVGYPLMRGTAPLLVTLAGVLLLGEHPTPVMWAGIVLICVGVVSLSLVGVRQAGVARALPFALANAALIASYTLVDAAGARASGNATSYVLWMYFFEGVPFALLVGWLRGRALLDAARARWRMALAAGACSASSYGIAVWAMTVAPVGAVSALRETSVVFALCLGRWLLKERLDARRWIGIAAVLAGALSLRI